ncbi:hypothetical protein OKW50_007979 [Paraburkholderia youngii]
MFAHDKFLTVPWNQGVFKVANHTRDDIERELASSFQATWRRDDNPLRLRGKERSEAKFGPAATALRKHIISLGTIS